MKQAKVNFVSQIILMNGTRVHPVNGMDRPRSIHNGVHLLYLNVEWNGILNIRQKMSLLNGYGGVVNQ